MDFLIGGGIIAIIAVVLVIAVVAGIVGFVVLRTWVKVARADEALVISGKKDKTGASDVEVVIKGRAIVGPMKRYETISLSSRQVKLSVDAQSLDNVTLKVDSVALVKIGSTKDMVMRASERFASKDAAIVEYTTEQLEGALRGVVSTLNVIDLMRDRKKFADQIAESIATELADQGLHLDSFQIKGISDEKGYIASLGKPEIEAKRQASEIATTNANRAITKQKTINSEADLIEQTAYQTNEQNANAEVGRARAAAEQAEALSRAQAEQAVLHQRAENRQAELDAEVKKVADAERYKAETEADAKAYTAKKVAEAQKVTAETKAEADAIVKQREADAEAYRMKASAEARKASAAADAEAIRAKASAEADAIEMTGKAKASAIQAEAEALRENQDAILAKELVGQLPAMMTEFAKGYANIGKITVIGDGGGNHMNGQSASAMAGLFESVKAGTGLDLASIIQGRVVGDSIGKAMQNGSAPAESE